MGNELKELIDKQEEIYNKTRICRISEGWTWKMYVGNDLIQTCKHIMSPKSCLENALKEWENVKFQGCTKFEIIQNSSKKIIHIFK